MDGEIPSDCDAATQGEVQLVGPEVMRELLYNAECDGYLPVPLSPPGPGDRGDLALHISDAIDTALERRGACAPGIAASSHLDAALSDQLYRARLIELRGIALGIPTLEGIANLAGTLDAEDSAVLRWWLAATEERPLRLYLDAANRVLGVYDRPMPLILLLDSRRRPRGEQAPQIAPELSASSAAMELSAPPPEVTEPQQPNDPPAPPLQELAAAMLPAASPLEPSEPNASATPFVRPADPEPLEIEDLEHGAAGSGEDAASDVAATAAAEGEAGEPGELLVANAATPAPLNLLTGLAAEVREPEADALDQAEPVAAPPGGLTHGPLYPNAAQEWRGWLRELEGARGPKPLAAIERMFVTSYVPLRDALTRGIAGREVAPVLDAWAASFERSYREAFDALRMRGKRPTMVLDTPEVALRISRLHGARSVQLILVDGMRFELGLRVEQRLRQLLGQNAALCERLLLWAALPASTGVQLELLGRGPEALREFTGSVDSETPVARGRMAGTLRRVKTGHRELLKLDIVESRLSEPGGREVERLDALADDTALALSTHIARQAPRTLVLVFGDHGFLLDPLDEGTTRARHGGASPEEVLVPAFAWLVGGVH